MGEQAPTPAPAESDAQPVPERDQETSGFIKGDPRIPAVVRVYGNVIAALNIAGMVLAIIGTLADMVTSGNPFALIGGAIVCAIGYVMLRLGQGLYRGERQAVYGICVLAILGVGLAVLSFFSSAMVGAVVLGIVCLLYGPPIIVAFGHWNLFH